MTKKSPPPISRETVLRYLIYDPDTGVFTRRIRASNRMPGDLAGTTIASGHVAIMVEGYRYMAHNLAWLITYGEFVFREVDHRDNVRGNNRIRNLRKATESQNNANRLMRSDNTSGIKGVSLDTASGKWLAKVGVGPGSNLGRFDTMDEAAAVRRAEFEKRYGEFARHS